MGKKSDTLLNDQLAIIEKDSETGIVTVTWNESCSNLLNERHQKEVDKINDQLAKLKPEKLLVNLEKCQYILTPGDNEWFEHTLYKMFGQSQPEVLAFVVPSNLFNHLFFEVNQEAMQERFTKTQYFRDKDKAWNWLIAE
jgi:hypothetical protein